MTFGNGAGALPTEPRGSKKNLPQRPPPPTPAEMLDVGYIVNFAPGIPLPKKCPCRNDSGCYLTLCVCSQSQKTDHAHLQNMFISGGKLQCKCLETGTHIKTFSTSFFRVCLFRHHFCACLRQKKM